MRTSICGFSPAGGETSSTSKRASAGIVASEGSKGCKLAATSAGVGQLAVPRTSIAGGAAGAAAAAASATAIGNTAMCPTTTQSH